MLQTLWRIKPFTQLRTSLFLHRDARVIQKRLLSLHEYQSQTLMKEFGIRVPPGFKFASFLWFELICVGSALAITPNEAESVARALDTQDLVVKAQILAGGRGLGVFENGFKGGVHICSSYVCLFWIKDVDISKNEMMKWSSFGDIWLIFLVEIDLKKWRKLQRRC